MTIAQLSSESSEHYTPREIILGVTGLLGAIDLDPASCELANSVVQAKEYYTEEDDGLVQPWHGRVFVNPPGGKPKNPTTGKRINKSLSQLFYFKAVQEWLSGRVEALVFLGFTLEILRLSQANSEIPSILRFPFCIPRERTQFLKDDGVSLKEQKDPTHANVLVFMPRKKPSVDPDELERFENIFSCFGDVVIPRDLARRPS